MELAKLPGAILDDKYRIDRLLGKGGMGAVYLATHLGTTRPVALKVIAPQFMTHIEFVERFKREAAAAGRLRHPNVVDVTDFGFAPVADGQVAYLVMEYLDGCTLAEVLAEESRLPLNWVVEILEQVCSAVYEAHQQGIIHRDLKPDNIWLEPNRRGGFTVKVLDFGLAKLADSSQTNEIAAPPADEFKGATTIASSQQAATTATIEPEASTLEAATLIQAPEPAAEAAPSPPPPAAVPAKAEPLEAETLVQPIAQATEAETRWLAATTAENPVAPSITASGEGLTRVGSIMGTPTYMSPEQCRGEALDARSDIYSLGVIAYQMLCGQPPFKGEMNQVMKGHLEALPAPLREKNPKVPKKVAHLIMTALAKDSAERPPSAAALGNALRAHAEGTGLLLRRAFALYSEHFPTFLYISFLAHIPLIVITALTFGLDWLRAAKILGTITEIILVATLGLLSFAANFLAASVLSGMTVPVVARLIITPLRPIDLRSAYRIFRQRLKPFLSTTIITSVLVAVGMGLCLIPGLIAAVRYALIAPVVMIEGLKNRAALARANELRRRSTSTVILIVLLQFAIPVVVSLLFSDISISNDVQVRANIKVKAPERITGLLNILIVPLLSILTTLLYLKLRHAGGETLREALQTFEVAEAPQSKWQMRLQERTRHSASETNRG